MNRHISKFIVDQTNEIISLRINDMKEMALDYNTEKIGEYDGFKIEVVPSYLLNGDLVISIEATRKRLFGYFVQSISTGFEISPDGTVTRYEKLFNKWETSRKREQWKKLEES